MLPAEIVDSDQQARPSDQRIPAPLHRPGAGMGGLAAEFDQHASAGIAAGDDADLHALAVEDRPLLDMELDIGVEGVRRSLHLTAIADAVELLADRLAIVVTPAERPVERIGAGKAARADHGRREAPALLIGPVDHLDRPFRAVAELVERAADLQPAEHAGDAVEAPAIHLRIEMAAHHHRRQAFILPGPAREDVADAVDAHVQARLLAPVDEEVAHLAVGIAERQPRKSARPADPDFGGALDRRPEAPDIDARGRWQAHECPLIPDAERAASSPTIGAPARSWQIDIGDGFLGSRWNDQVHAPVCHLRRRRLTAAHTRWNGCSIEY